VAGTASELREAMNVPNRITNNNNNNNNRSGSNSSIQNISEYHKEKDKLRNL
jgi:hypothetical protein